jgi:filamentous hemagglutinin family protein
MAAHRTILFSRKRFQEIAGSAQLRAALTLLALSLASNARANPAGMSVVSGSASAVQNGSRLNITASQNAFLNWQSFNINAGETTTFIQPSATSIVWNKINDANPSQIWGNLNANGVVVLMNQNGFFFGPNSTVNAAGFVATTAVPYVPSSGGGWEFNGPPPAVPIINYGNISVHSGGSIYLIADAIENHGTLYAPDGSVELHAGKNVLISDRPDGTGISVGVTLPSGSVNNDGKIIADAGTILLSAQTVNQNGLVQANSVQNKNGVIELVASDAVNLGDNSQLIAHGDDSVAGSSGGSVAIKSENVFSDTANSQIVTRGSSLGGNGGNVEVSAPAILSLDSTMDASAQTGWLGGNFSLDPANITLGNSGSGVVPNNGTVAYNSGSGTLSINVNTAFANKNFSSITLQATANINLAANTIWNLSQSTGVSAGQLTLQAGGNIVFGNGSQITDANNWAVALMAGVNFSSGTVQSGLGSIWLGGSALGTGSGSIQTAAGMINLTAGKDILVGSGFVRTTGGGNIFADALAGNVNAGTKNAGFRFTPGANGFVLGVDPNLGGISTAAGGNVNITAGNDIISIPGTTGNGVDAGSGAFGSQAGNVTLNAGHDVVGHFVVANGVGTIAAGDDAGNTSHSLALSLISGGWSVNAAQDILLQEVRNPNGIFNSLGFSSSTTKHFFDYAPGDYVNLTAGNSVQLLGGSLPRTTDIAIPPIYPGTLNIVAGAGGVQVDNDIILFPSPVGQLSIVTTAGGSLVGNKPGDLAQIIMSDSGASQFTSAASFGADDHATTPIHVNDSQPVTLDIAGDMSNILLVSPKATDITIGGDMINSRLQIQNLHSTDVSSLNVTGNILNRNDFTSVVLSSAPDFNVFNIAYPPLTGSMVGLAGLFHWDPVTMTLTFEGRMSGDVLQTLMNLQVQVFDSIGNPVLGANGNPVTQPAQFISSAALQQLFTASQDIPLNPNTGYVIAGPGAFNVNANNMDLGATRGIQSIGPANNTALALLPGGNSGAAINVNLTGNLDMFSTTISSLAGGDVTVNAGGDINVGSSTFAGNDANARGIFTVAKSDVTVLAGGDINVNGSRIAAYDGGNVFVESLHGNVNAGTGASGAATVEEVIVNPVTGQVQTYAPTIPGSGILATTFPPSLDPTFPSSHNAVGNILVKTPEGNIVASGGGIVQLPLNGVNSSDASVTLIAGTKDANGNVIYAGNIDASGSGVIGANVNLQASGNISGFVVAQNNLNVAANQNVSVTAVAAGNADVSAGGAVSGTIVGIGSVAASGTSVDASLLSQNVSASGNTSGAQVGFAAANAAGSTSQGAQQDSHDVAKAVASSDSDDDTLEKKKKLPTLTRQSRVTVILPKKS